MIFSILSLVISVIGASISIFVFFQTLFSERLNLEISFIDLIEAPSNNPSINHLYMDLIFTNKSKLPISIISVELITDNKNIPFSVLQADFISTIAKKRPIVIHTTRKYSNNEIKKEIPFYSSGLPINLSPLSASNEILTFNIKEFHIRQSKELNNRLLIQTSRGNIETPVPKGITIDIVDWVKEKK